MVDHSKATRVHKERKTSKVVLLAVVATLVATGLYLVYRSFAGTEDVVTPYSILIVAGQSNAAGSEALVDDTTKNFHLFATPNTADSEVQLMWMGTDTNGGTKPQPLKTPQLANGNKGPAQFGPEIGLGLELYRLGRRKILIVKAAFGGMPLYMDANTGSNTWNPASTKSGYSLMIAKVKQAMAYLDEQGEEYSLDGMYWLQGESDVKATASTQYEANLRALINKVRSDLPFNPKAQLVIGQINLDAYIKAQKDLLKDKACAPDGCVAYASYAAAVRAAQQKIASTTANTTLVDTASLARNGLGLHLTSASQLQLGTMFATASAAKLPVQQATTDSSANDTNDEAISDEINNEVAVGDSAVDESTDSVTDESTSDVAAQKKSSDPAPSKQMSTTTTHALPAYIWVMGITGLMMVLGAGGKLLYDYRQDPIDKNKSI